MKIENISSRPHFGMAIKADSEVCGYLSTNLKSVKDWKQLDSFISSQRHNNTADVLLSLNNKAADDVTAKLIATVGTKTFIESYGSWSTSGIIKTIKKAVKAADKLNKQAQTIAVDSNPNYKKTILNQMTKR